MNRRHFLHTTGGVMAGMALGGQRPAAAEPDVKAALLREGLKAPSAHISPLTLLIGWEKRLDDAKTLGHQYLIVPSFTDDTSQTLDQWREWADHFNKAGAH